jgi:hypothetical protein
MQKKLRRRVLLAAGVMLCSSISWGQQRLIANIPFEFRSPAGDMKAGHYEIVAGDGANGNLTRFRNLDSKKAVLMLSGGRTDGQEDGSATVARLLFRCNGSDCALMEIRPGNGDSGWWFKQPKKPFERRIEMATVTIPALVSDEK